MAEVIQTNRNDLNTVKAWSLILGISMIILGVLTISFSVLTTFITVLFLGIVLLLRGIFEIVESILKFHNEYFWQRLISGIFSVGVGFFLMAKPVMAVSVLTLTIAVFLIVIGLYRAIGSLFIRTDNWGWIALSGILAVVLGFFIWAGWPVTALWFIGLLVGVEILSHGIELTMLPYIVENAQKRVGAGTGKPAMGH